MPYEQTEHQTPRWLLLEQARTNRIVGYLATACACACFFGIGVICGLCWAWAQR